MDQALQLLAAPALHSLGVGEAEVHSMANPELFGHIGQETELPKSRLGLHAPCSLSAATFPMLEAAAGG